MVIFLGFVLLAALGVSVEGAAVDGNSEDYQVEGAAMHEGRIPWQLVLTSKDGSTEALPPAVQRNVYHTLNMSLGFRVRLLSDAMCLDFIRNHYGQSLARIFTAEKQGSYRSDICRAAVLAQEGGFYLDMDLELKAPLKSFVDAETTFVSAFDVSKNVYNAVLATEPLNPIMQEAIKEIRQWYDEARHSTSELLGTLSTLRALRTVVQSQCPGEPLHPDNRLQRTCGEQVIRMYWERHLDCRGKDAVDCPKIRKESGFDGMKFGIYTSEFEGKLVGWSRFADCSSMGCDVGGVAMIGGKSNATQWPHYRRHLVGNDSNSTDNCSSDNCTDNGTDGGDNDTNDTNDTTNGANVTNATTNGTNDTSTTTNSATTNDATTNDTTTSDTNAPTNGTNVTNATTNGTNDTSATTNDASTNDSTTNNTNATTNDDSTKDATTNDDITNDAVDEHATVLTNAVPALSPLVAFSVVVAASFLTPLAGFA